MKVTTGGYIRTPSAVRPFPTYGVYRSEDWKLIGRWAVALSLHWSFDAAKEAAEQEESRGRFCTVVSFDHEEKQKYPTVRSRYALSEF